MGIKFCQTSAVASVKSESWLLAHDPHFGKPSSDVQNFPSVVQLLELELLVLEFNTELQSNSRGC